LYVVSWLQMLKSVEANYFYARSVTILVVFIFYKVFFRTLAL